MITDTATTFFNALQQVKLYNRNKKTYLPITLTSFFLLHVVFSVANNCQIDFLIISSFSSKLA